MAGTSQSEPVPDPVIVFDGMCVLCSANAQFVLKHDKKRVFRLAAMQGDIGASLMRDVGVDPGDPESFVLIDGGKVYMDSDAVLRMWGRLGWPWKASGVFKAVPRFVRDPLYRLVARNRYRIFGKRETCWVPTPEQAERVL